MVPRDCDSETIQSAQVDCKVTSQLKATRETGTRSRELTWNQKKIWTRRKAIPIVDSLSGKPTVPPEYQ